MKTLKAIVERRSIRRYLSEDVTPESINRILQAATYAPSAHNAQPWRFAVIRESRVRQMLAEAMAHDWNLDLERDGVPDDKRKSLLKGSIERFTSAPVIILACLTMEDMDKYPDERRTTAERVMAIQSVAAAVQNILLASHSEGLGACWYCAPLFCPDTVRRILLIPTDVEPQVLITIGRPAENPHPPSRKPLNEIVHHDRW